nr:SulP family inorganic anion transporter [Parenemella sanctibonifatiensis]
MTPQRPKLDPEAIAPDPEPTMFGSKVRAGLTRARTLLPGLDDYRDLRRTWKADLLAGVTVGIVALPLALGFGVSSGLTAEQGLVTAIVAGLLAAVFGGSNVQVSGPTGAMVVVLLPIVASHGAGAVAAVTLLAGIIVLAAGALRLGRVVGVIPWSVIEGFTLGIACIIFLQQVPLVTSAEQAAPGEHSTNAFVAAIQSLAAADPTYLGWGLAAVAVVVASMMVAPRIHPLVPGSLIGIVCRFGAGDALAEPAGNHRHHPCRAALALAPDARMSAPAPAPGCPQSYTPGSYWQSCTPLPNRSAPSRWPRWPASSFSPPYGWCTRHRTHDPALHPFGCCDPRPDGRHHGFLRLDCGRRHWSRAGGILCAASGRSLQRRHARADPHRDARRGRR